MKALQISILCDRCCSKKAWAVMTTVYIKGAAIRLSADVSEATHSCSQMLLDTSEVNRRTRVKVQ